MPEETKQTKIKQVEIMTVELLEPKVKGESVLIESLEPLDFENAKVLSFFEIS